MKLYNRFVITRYCDIDKNTYVYVLHQNVIIDKTIEILATSVTY